MSTTGGLAVSTLTVKVPWPSRTVAGTIRLYGADSSSSWIVMFASSRLLLSHGAAGLEEFNPEPLCTLDDGVVQDGHRDGPLGDAWVEVQGAAGGVVVPLCGLCGDVGGPVPDRDVLARGLAELDGEDRVHPVRALVGLVDRYVDVLEPNGRQALAQVLLLPGSGQQGKRSSALLMAMMAAVVRVKIWFLMCPPFVLFSWRWQRDIALLRDPVGAAPSWLC